MYSIEAEQPRRTSLLSHVEDAPLNAFQVIDPTLADAVLALTGAANGAEPCCSIPG